MKKRLACVFACLIMCVCILTGCNLFPIDVARYMNAVVASVEYEDGYKIEITKKELITAYQNYGTQLVGNYGMTEEDAIKQTLDVLVNRKVILKEAERLITLTNKDKNYLFDETLKALEANIDEFHNTVAKEWGLLSDKEEDESVVGTVYAPYEKSAEVVYDMDLGKYVIKVLDKTQSPAEDLRNDYATAAGKAAMLAAYNSYIGTDKVYKAANERYIKQLLINEEGLKLSQDKESVFAREVERIYTNLKENLYVEKYQELTKDGTGISPISVDKLLEYYKFQILKDYTKYKVNPKSFTDSILSDVANINYILNNEYFYVSHILIKFNDEQQAEYDALQTFRQQGGSALEYKQRLDDLYDSLKATERNAEGNIVADSDKTVDTVIGEIQTALNYASSKHSKGDAFNKFIYRYNEDDGIMNAEYNYVIGLNDSQMVESFTDAARELHEAGVVGAISEPVISNYGVHIVFYAGPVENLFEVSSADTFNLSDADILELTQARLNLCADKTVFDKVYETMVSDNYSIFEALNINYLKDGLKIKFYKNNYKDMIG